MKAALMDDAIEEMDIGEERQWSRRRAVIRAMADRGRFFTVRLDLDDEAEVPEEDGSDDLD